MFREVAWVERILGCACTQTSTVDGLCCVSFLVDFASMVTP